MRLAPLVAASWIAAPSPPAPDDAARDVHTSYPRFRALDRIDVFEAPRRAERIGWIAAGSVFEIAGETDGSRCDEAWVAVRGGGFACLEGTEPAPDARPHLPAARPGSAVPFVYAHRARDPAFSYAFSKRAIDDDGEPVLVRPGGRELDADHYDLHTPSRFEGVSLDEHPAPEGMLPAWTIVANTPVYAVPAEVGEPAGVLPKHTRLWVETEPVDEEGHWYRVPHALGLLPGFVDDRTAIRHWTPAPPIDEVGPDEVWVDLDLQQQVIALRRGPELVYVTLVSSGVRSRRTPTGLYRIRDKRAWSSMGSRPDAEEPYFVEKVPWTMYFRDSYALHGAYWHDVFGHRRSHGCINLAPRDAKVLYDALSPQTETAMMRTYASEDNPGSYVRIRRGLRPVPDRTDD